MNNLCWSQIHQMQPPGEVVKVVHDDGNEEVQHDESAKEDEGDKVDVGAV